LALKLERSPRRTGPDVELASEARRTALARHDEIVREAIEAAGVAGLRGGLRLVRGAGDQRRSRPLVGVARTGERRALLRADS